MPILHAIVLGITQGLSEFLPISSSGHLLLVPWLFGWTTFAGDPQLEKVFDVALHLGTFAGALAYFWKDAQNLVVGGVRSLVRRRIDGHEERMAWLVAAACVPAVITGVLFDDVIAERLGAKPLIATMLIVFGVVLYVCDRRRGRKGERDLGLRDALLIGVAQALALQPGVSRSGATISMARGIGYDRAPAARISFLLSLPITLGAAIYSLASQLAEGGIPSSMVPAFVWGIAASAVTGWVAVWGTIRFVKSRSFAPFVVYRIGLGIFVLSLIGTGVRSG